MKHLKQRIKNKRKEKTEEPSPQVNQRANMRQGCTLRMHIEACVHKSVALLLCVSGKCRERYGVTH